MNFISTIRKRNCLSLFQMMEIEAQKLSDLHLKSHTHN